MRKLFFIICTLIFNIVVVKLYRASSDFNRVPASTNELPKNSCVKSIKSFFSKSEFSLVKYEKYYQDIDPSLTRSQFDNIEHYVAYIDKKIGSENLSLAQYLVQNSKSKTLYQFVVNSSRPERFYSFLFNDMFNELIYKSVQIKGLSSSKEFALKQLMIEKIADEALEKLSEKPNSRWSRFVSTKFSKRIFDLISYLPVAFGMPPLKLPHVLIGSEKDLLGAKSLKEMKEVFSSLSEEDKELLLVKKGYDLFRRYYAIAIAGYYSYITANEVIEVNRDEDLLVSMNESVDEAITDLKEMSSPSCKSIYRCLDDYREEWDERGEEIYLEYKNVCKDVYSVKEDC